MLFFGGSLEVRNHANLGWRWPRYYRPTVLHRHGLMLGPLTIWWKKDLGR